MQVQDVALTKMTNSVLVGFMKFTVDEFRKTFVNDKGTNSMPAQQQMKQARLAAYPEYKALIQILNAFAITDDERSYEYGELIKTLNGNIDYVRIHAMSKSAAGEESGDEPVVEQEQGNKDKGE